MGTALRGAWELFEEGREADRASSMLEPPLGGGSGERHVQRMPGPVRRGLLLCPHSNALLSRAVRESRFSCAQVDDLPTLFLEKEVAVRSVRSGSGGRFCANGRGPGLALGSGQQPPSKQLWHRLLTFRSPRPSSERRALAWMRPGPRRGPLANQHLRNLTCGAVGGRGSGRNVPVEQHIAVRRNCLKRGLTRGLKRAATRTGRHPCWSPRSEGARGSGMFKRCQSRIEGAVALLASQRAQSSAL